MDLMVWSSGFAALLSGGHCRALLPPDSEEMSLRGWRRGLKEFGGMSLVDVCRWVMSVRGGHTPMCRTRTASCKTGGRGRSWLPLRFEVKGCTRLKDREAASCSSTCTDREDSITKIIFKYQILNRVFITLRSDNTFTVNIFCLSQVLLIISFTVAVIGFFQLSLVAVYILKVYLRKPTSSRITEVEENSGTSSRYLQDCIPYNYKLLAQAAKGFSEEIGQGSFGVVYRGSLLHEGRQRDVAIKRMHLRHRSVDENFEGEIKRIGMLRHKNVLQLLGYSDTTEKDKPLLMVTPLYSSLAKHLEDDSLPWLNWAARFKMAVGVAEGLAYLHDGAQQRLVHHDIKPGNILFDKETFQAYIADFGCSRLMEPMRDEVETENIIGTTGYMDPHFGKHKKRTAKVDVYSFGVVLFVLVAGGEQSTKVSDLVDRAVDTDFIDPDFSRRDASSYKHDEIIRTLQVARLCTKYEPNIRPTMSEVVMMLRGDIPVSRIAQDLSRVADSVATFAHSAFSTMKSFNTRTAR